VQASESFHPEFLQLAGYDKHSTEISLHNKWSSFYHYILTSSDIFIYGCIDWFIYLWMEMFYVFMLFLFICCLFIDSRTITIHLTETHTWVHANKWTHANTHTYIYIYTLTHTQTNTHMPTRTHTDIYTHVHTHTNI